MVAHQVMQPVALVTALGDEVGLQQPPERSLDLRHRDFQAGGQRVGGELGAGVLYQAAVQPGGGGVEVLVAHLQHSSDGQLVRIQGGG